jgi:tRNA G18 (ribose-2'-O)-methylase SpoU
MFARQWVITPSDGAKTPPGAIPPPSPIVTLKTVHVLATPTAVVLQLSGMSPIASTPVVEPKVTAAELMARPEKNTAMARQIAIQSFRPMDRRLQRADDHRNLASMPLTVILEDIRSTYNVGAIARTLDAVGGGRIICAGITPYPELGPDDDRSPVVISSNSKAIAKTALGAEATVEFAHAEDVEAALAMLPAGTQTFALEQDERSIELFDLQNVNEEVALLLGSETQGIAPAALELCDAILEITQFGTKESLNVSVAAGIALFHLRRSQP